VSDVREVEDRRFNALQALKGVTDALRETNPQTIFPVASKDGVGLDTAKMQSIANRWADEAGSVLIDALRLAKAINADALNLFTGEPSDGGAERI
jgi:hypothetical protein